MEYKEIKDTSDFIKSKIDFKPKIAVVLGSGLGSFVDEIDVKYTLNYSDITHFPHSTVIGHNGRFVFGYIKNIPLVIMQGRFHCYEGYTAEKVVLPIRVMKLLGAEILILTNASGGISFKAGTLMVIKDHISNFATNPLLGKNINELGTRFPDMSNVYDKSLINIIHKTAEEKNIKLDFGVYIQLTGPSFETPAEIRMCKILGADAVGMSTVQEAIAARHLGFKVCGISLITNAAANEFVNLNHEEVIKAAAESAEKFKTLLTYSIIEIEKNNL